MACYVKNSQLIFLDTKATRKTVLAYSEIILGNTELCSNLCMSVCFGGSRLFARVMCSLCADHLDQFYPDQNSPSRNFVLPKLGQFLPKFGCQKLSYDNNWVG